MKRNKNKGRARQNILESYGLLDSPKEKLYDDITSLAASICNAEICLITLVRDTKEFYTSHFGITIDKAPEGTAFFQYMFTNKIQELIVTDTTNDPKFIKDPWVESHPNINFFAGVLLMSPTDTPFGVLSVMDSKPQELKSYQRKALHTLAQQIIQLFELRKTTIRLEKTKVALKSKEELLNSILESIEIGVWKWEKTSDFIQLNTEGAKIIGKSTKGYKQLTREDWNSRIHPHDLEQTLNKLENCFPNKNEAYTISYRIFDQQKDIIWIEETGKVLKWSENLQPVIVQATLFNITEELQNAAKLEITKRNQEALINGTKDLLWSVDTQYNFIIANKAFEQMIKANLGRKLYPGESALQKEFGKENLIKWKSYYDRALRGEQFSIKEKLEDPSNPETAYGLISLSPIYGNSNEPLGVSCFSKDITEEVLLQQVTLKAKEETDKILNTSLDIICTVDRNGHFLTINKACFRIWGYTPQELIGKKYIDFVFPDDKNASLEIEKLVVRGEKIRYFENRYLHKTNYVVPMIWSANWDEDEEIMYCVARDNTEIKIAAEQLANSELRFKALVQEGNEMIGIIDENANYIYVSPTTTKILNIDPDTFVGTNALEYIHPDDQKMIQSKLLEIIDNKKPITVSFRFKNKEGEWLWLETIATNKLDEPHIKGIVLNTRDITERKRVTEQLARSERRFKTLVQEGTELIAIFDQEANFTYVSPTSNRTLNIQPELLVGTNAFEHIHPDDHEEVYAQFLETLQKPQVYIHPFRFKNGNGEWTWLETIATNKTEEPTINGIVVNTRDVTDRVLHLKEIEEQNKVLREISWNQSHVVRAPVARLMGLINLLKEDAIETEEKEKVFNFIISSAEEIDNIIKNNVEQTTRLTDLENLK